MKVVVVGATGNVGTSVLDALAREPAVGSVVGLARRLPEVELPKDSFRDDGSPTGCAGRPGGTALPFETSSKTRFAVADVTHDDLVPHFRGAAAVVLLAWLIQPSRDQALLRRTNVGGTGRVLAAVAAARVPALVFASSIGVYSPGPGDRPVDETWPRDGVRGAWYSEQKAEAEGLLDRFELEHPGVRVVRLRYAYALKRASASGQRRLFLGPLVPGALLRPGRVPFVPDVRGLTVQLVHTDDVGEAYRLAVVGGSRGAFNLAADPPLRPADLARTLRSRTLPLPAGALRAAAAATWHARLQPTSSDWVDLALAAPVLDTGRARRELGWAPTRTAPQALLEWLEGAGEAAGLPTAPLRPGRRLAELVAPVSSLGA